MGEAEVTPERIFTLSRGWMEAKVFMTAVKLDLFTLLGDGSMTATQIAGELGTEAGVTELFLNALAAFGFLRKEEERFSNTQGSASFLMKGKDSYFGHVAVQSDASWDYWGKLEQRLKTGKPVGEPMHLSNDREYIRNFIYSLHTRSIKEAENLSRELDLRGSRRLLDLGGGPGTYCVAFSRANPELETVVYDLPQVIEVTQELIAAAGMEGRIKLQPGDFRTDSLGSGFDTLFLSAVIHLYDAETNRSLLRKAFDSLIPGGKIILQDHVMNEARTAPTFGAIMSLHLNLTRSGARMYSFQEVKGWLEVAGFINVAKMEGAYQVSVRPSHSIVTALKPRQEAEPP